jgi:hypothetical protein
VAAYYHKQRSSSHAIPLVISSIHPQINTSRRPDQTLLRHQTGTHKKAGQRFPFHPSFTASTKTTTLLNHIAHVSKTCQRNTCAPAHNDGCEGKHRSSPSPGRNLYRHCTLCKWMV